jgi:hypothetical protein
MLHETGFTDIAIGDPADTFGESSGEQNARTYEVFGYAFIARRR